MTDKIKVCPLCHYLGDKGDEVCPHCGVRLISECPKCRAPIKTPFAEYCSICGANFKEEVGKKPEVGYAKHRATKKSSSKRQEIKGYKL